MYLKVLFQYHGGGCWLYQGPWAFRRVDRARAEALAAAKELTLDELFLLVQSLDLEKGKGSRIFNQDMLKAPSIVRRVAGGKKGVKAALKGLKTKGFVEVFEHKKLKATTRGNSVKHVFDEVAKELAGQGGGFNKNAPDGVNAVLEHLESEAGA